MEQGLSSSIWQASRLSCAAQITACWIRSRSKAVCTRPSDQPFSREDQWEGSGSSTTAPMSRWGRRATAAVLWWPPTQQPSKRAASVTPARGWSTNSFSPISRKTPSPPPTWWRFTRPCGAFEPVLSDEDHEQDPDRGCSYSPAGQEAWQIVSQWVWNLRLELGHQLSPTPLRTVSRWLPRSPRLHRSRHLCRAMANLRSPCAFKAGRFCGQDFAHEGDGTLACPASKTLRPTAQQSFADGSLRVLYSARILDCRGCSLRKPRQWHGEVTTKPRRGSRLLHPLPVGLTSIGFLILSAGTSARSAFLPFPTLLFLLGLLLG
ncbi:MAG: hypothetical protein ACJ8CB_24765, partial [Ktedonobacteraceae bacterium]